MRDRPFERGVDLRLQPLAEQKRFHILDQELLVFGIDRAQTVVVDQLVLRHQPGFPATLANLLVNLFAQGVAERRFFQAGQFVSAARAFDNVSHFSSGDSEWERRPELSGRRHSIATEDVTKLRSIVSITFTGSLLGFHQELI
jgi:hypothetical protein